MKLLTTMKYKLLLSAILMAGTSFAIGLQNDVQKKKADFFATEAIKHFKLDDSKQQEIAQAKLDLMIAQSEMQRKLKNGDLAEADKKDYHKENVQPYGKKLMEVLGVNWRELKPFNDKVHPEMNKIRKGD